MFAGKMFGCLAVAALVAPVAAVGETPSLVPSRASLTIPYSLDGKRVPFWTGNSLVVEQSVLGVASPSVLVFDSSGTQVLSATLTIPEAAQTYVDGYARSADGSIAACGASYASDGRGAPFIALISADGNAERVIRMEPYWPVLITVAPDGTLWTVGYEQNANRSEKSGVNLNASVLRHFDRSGKPLGAFLPRSSFRNPVELNRHHGYLLTSADRVGWFHWLNDGQGAYHEVSPAGEITSYPIPRLPSLKTDLMVDGVAMPDFGDVFVSMRDAGLHEGYFVFKLDRQLGQWSQTVLSGPRVAGDFAVLWGSSGSDLVFQLPSDFRTNTLRFFAPQR